MTLAMKAFSNTATPSSHNTSLCFTAWSFLNLDSHISGNLQIAGKALEGFENDGQSIAC